MTLSTGAVVNADLLLWGTGYEIDLGYFDNPALSGIQRHDTLAAQCGCGIRALAEPNLYFLAPALESTGTAPWVCALMARTLTAHTRGQASLEAVPLPHKINHFHNLAFLAERDPESFPPGQWEAHYRRLATAYPADQPLPIPDWRLPSKKRVGVCRPLVVLRLGCGFRVTAPPSAFEHSARAGCTVWRVGQVNPAG